MSDNVVLLSYAQQDNSINRTMAVIKSRASHHDPAIREFTIGSHGIVLSDPPLSLGEPGTRPPLTGATS